MSSESSSDRAAVLVGAGILASRVSGVIREIVLSYWLGVTTLAGEAFAFALSVPKVLQNLLGEGSLSASFIPVYSQVVDDDPRAARRLAGAVFGVLAAIVGAVVAILMVAAHPIVAVLARGAGDERADLIAQLVRLMAPGIGFIVFAAWCLGILNSHRDFFVSYVAPVLWNAAIVAAIIIWSGQSDSPVELAEAGAWGVFIGGIAQFAVQFPRVLRLAGPITPTLDRSLPATRQVLSRFPAAVASRGVVTLATFVELGLSSFLAVGAFAVLAKAQVLYLLPISVFALALAAADLPELSREAGDTAAAATRVTRSVDRVVLFLTFSMLAFIFGGRSIVGALFERGAFGPDDTVAVWVTLAVFSLGLLASGLSRLLQNAAFAQGDVKGPASIAAIRLVVAAAVGFALMWPADRFAVVAGSIEQLEAIAISPLPEQVRDTPNTYRLGAAGLGAAGALAAWVEFALLRRRVGPVAARLGVGRSLRRLIPGAVVATVLLALLAEITIDWHPLAAAPLVVGLPGLIYIAGAAARGNSTAIELVDQLRRE